MSINSVETEFVTKVNPLYSLLDILEGTSDTLLPSIFSSVNILSKYCKSVYPLNCGTKGGCNFLFQASSQLIPSKYGCSFIFLAPSNPYPNLFFGLGTNN